MRKMMAAMAALAGGTTLLNIAGLRQGSRHRRQAAIRRRCSNAYLGHDTSICRVLGRYKMFVDTGDIGLSSHLLLDGFWEMWMVEAILSLVKPGMTVLDAGANLGYFTLLLADCVGEKGRVHAFEPNPRIADRLRASVEINDFGARSTVYEIALSDRGGAAALAVPSGQPKNGHVIDDTHRPGAIAIDVARLDSFADLLDVDFIKIDVEGSEERLWSGMAGLLARQRPLTILLEFTAARYSDPNRFMTEILGHGFSLGYLTPDEGIVPMSPVQLLQKSSHEDQMIVLRR